MAVSQAQLNAIYENRLGRTADSTGVSTYSGYKDAAAVDKAVMGSTEYKQHLADPYNVSGLSKNLATDVAGMQSPVDVYNAALDKLGIADSRTQVQDTRTALNNTQALYDNVNQDVTGRLAETLATEGQRRRLVASEQAPLAGQLDTLGRNLSTAQAGEQDILNQAGKSADMYVTGEQNKRQALMDQLKVAIDNTSNLEQKRQWQADYNRLVAQDAEAKRQYNLNYALDKQKVAISAANSGSSSQSAASLKLNDMATSAQNLESKVGPDGHVSEETWNKAESDWIASGYSAADFVKNFIQYVNPRYTGYHGYN